jgi:hypothetical protein
VKDKLSTKTESNRVTVFLLGALAIAGIAAAQTPNRVFRVPFHTVHGMILLDATVNGHPAALPVDIGANNSILSPNAAGVDAVQLRALQATHAGTGAEGDSATREVNLQLAERRWSQAVSPFSRTAQGSKRR